MFDSTCRALTLSSDDIKKIFAAAAVTERQTVLFIDEIHRLNRPKQDAFLDALETGRLILMGATTENPYFSLQPALRSRILIFELFPLTKDNMKNILDRALKNDEVLKTLELELDDGAEEYLLDKASDPRNMLTILETAVLNKSAGSNAITKSDISDVIQKADTVYDHKNAHYDVISAFIKSVRGTDPDAALYYLALMIESGEDPMFIFRRLLILAVEDIGMAYPDAINVVRSCADSFEKIGFPEGRLFLSHAAVYLSVLPKSNSAYLAVDKALDFVKKGNIPPVPDYLRDSASYQKISGYKYPHDYPGHYVKQQYMSKPETFYTPQDIGFEKRVKERLSRLQ